MKTLDQLISLAEPAWPLVESWLAEALVPYELLPCSHANGEQALVDTQVTTSSPMGALVYHTAGLLVDHGWLRFLGAGGHERFQRSLPAWNAGRSDRFYLIADDAVGGLFAMNGGAFGEDVGQVYYFAPDSLEWEPLGLGYTDFFTWSLSDRLAKFYESVRWDGWEAECRELSGDRVFGVYPPLWAKGPQIGDRSRRSVPVAEWYDLQFQFLEQMERTAEAIARKPQIG